MMVVAGGMGDQKRIELGCSGSPRSLEGVGRERELLSEREGSWVER